MPNETTYNSGQIISYLLGICSTLIIFSGVCCGYIWRRHVSDNDCKFSKNDHDHELLDGKIEGIKRKK